MIKNSVIVIDDDPVCIETLSIMLESHDIKATAALNIDSLRNIDLNKFKAIFLDIWLSDSYGEESLEIISKLNYKGPIILISGMEKEEIKIVSRKGLLEGLYVAGYLMKPIRKPELSEILSRFVL